MFYRFLAMVRSARRNRGLNHDQGISAWRFDGIGGGWASSAPGTVHAESDNSSSPAWRRAEVIHQRNTHGDDAAYVQPLEILDDLHEDNKGLLALLKEARAHCNCCLDIATASLVEIWIDETARRNWVFSQAVE